MNFCKPKRVSGVSLWVSEKIFMNANRMGDVKIAYRPKFKLVLFSRFELMVYMTQQSCKSISWNSFSITSLISLVMFAFTALLFLRSSRGFSCRTPSLPGETITRG